MHVAILGIGEVGSTLARDLLAQGVTVTGWDPNPRNLPDGLHFADSNPDAAKQADLILSVNLAAVAVDVAREILPVLKAKQIYADMNTSGPTVKQNVALLFEGGEFVFTDVAILAPIALEGIRTPLLASGPGAAQFAEVYEPFGAPIKVFDEPAGHAATLKLVRSIFYKGLAAVVMETLEAAQKVGLTAYAREQMLTILQNEPMIDRFVNGSRKHARRRIHEMDAVIELLDSIDVKAHCSLAARQRLSELLEGEAFE
ncbi:MAG: NAD(P)-dependent oxidoreductase [Anaerolineae bacterium]|nr:NAD(P)-dependent oxidoreductase [Anaerolineae bacterium]